MSTRIIVRIEDDWDIAVPKSELRKKLRFRWMGLSEQKIYAGKSKLWRREKKNESRENGEIY